MKQLTKDPLVGTEQMVNKINEIVIAINRGKIVGKNSRPMKKGSRPMYAVLGSGGGIYGFASSAYQARNIRDNIWNIGKKRPERYLVTFEKI